MGTKGDPDPQQPPAPNQQLASIVGAKTTAATAAAKSASSLSIVREQSQPLGTARTKAEPLEQQQTQPLSLFFGAFFVFVVFLFPGSGEGEEGGRESEKEEEVEKVGEAEVDLISTTHLHCPTRPFSSHVSA